MKKYSILLLSLFFFSIQLLTAVADAPQLNVSNANEESSQSSLKPHHIVRRAAFDIGSGEIKMQVSDVDLTVNKIAKVLLTESAPIALREDLVKSLDGRLSKEIENKMVDTISLLMKKAVPFHPEECHAIATESLRLAKNSDTLLERIKNETGLTVTIISQEEEGILGFISAVNEADIDPDTAVSWDFGGGSFQITTKCGDRYLVYRGKLGKVPFKNALLKIQGKGSYQTLSPNPISQAQANQAYKFIKDTLKDFPVEIRQKLKQSDVVVLAIGIPPLWGMPDNIQYGKLRVLKEIELRLDLDDEAITIKDSIGAKYSPYVVSNLILAYGLMDALEIDRVKYVGTPGANAIGTLLSPQYWSDQTLKKSQQHGK